MLKKIFSKLKQLSFFSLAFLVSFIVFMGIAVVYAWTEPSQSPPGGNVSAPVNIGSASQYKSGALGVGGVFQAYSTAIFDGNVGIGISGPATRLEVRKDGGGDQEVARFSNPSGNPYITVGNGLTGTTGGYMLFDNSNDGIKINTHGYGNGLFIKADKVGIGTTGPGARLHIQGGGGNGLQNSASGIFGDEDSNGNPRIELRSSAKSPYIDFVNNLASDYNMRWILLSSTELGLYDSNGNQVIIFDQGN